MLPVYKMLLYLAKWFQRGRFLEILQLKLELHMAAMFNNTNRSGRNQQSL